MSRTPDRFPGESFEEGIVFDPNPVDPPDVGGMRFDGTTFRLRDSSGVFNPRLGAVAAGTKQGQILVAMDSVTFEPRVAMASRGDGWLANVKGQLLVGGG